MQSLFFVPEDSELLQILQSSKLWWLLKIPTQELEKQYVSISVKNRTIKQQPELILEFLIDLKRINCVFEENSFVSNAKEREGRVYYIPMNHEINQNTPWKNERKKLQIDQGEKQDWLSLAMFSFIHELDPIEYWGRVKNTHNN